MGINFSAPRVAKHVLAAGGCASKTWVPPAVLLQVTMGQWLSNRGQPHILCSSLPPPVPDQNRGYAQFKSAQERQRVLLEPPVMMQHQLDKISKRNVVLLGLTGVGKSTTANRMTDSQDFSVSDSMVSVTSKVQYKDVGKKFFTRMPPADYRVIDTPGFFDTTMTQQQVAEALKEFAAVGREGLAAILIVVRNGRFTQENQAVLKFVELVLGVEALAKYGILVVTQTSKSSSELKVEFDSLPETNLGRQMANVVQGRIVSIGPWEHAGKIFQAVEELFANNAYSALDCDMMNFERVRQQQEREFEECTRALRSAHEEDKKQLEEKLAKMELAMERASQQNNVRVTQIAEESFASILAATGQFLLGVSALVSQCSVM